MLRSAPIWISSMPLTRGCGPPTQTWWALRFVSRSPNGWRPSTVSTAACPTGTPSNGRLAWSDGNGPAEINHAHHPDELLNDPEDDP